MKKERRYWCTPPIQLGEITSTLRKNSKLLDLDQVRCVCSNKQNMLVGGTDTKQ